MILIEIAQLDFSGLFKAIHQLALHIQPHLLVFPFVKIPDD
jgi:hypothetical protein